MDDKIKQNVPQDQSPAAVIFAALQTGKDLKELEALLALQERWETSQARKAYNKAMAEFKLSPIKIEKDQIINYVTTKGGVGYKHASLANIVNKITAQLGIHELSVSWRTKQENGEITVICRVSHAMGHYEETALSAGADNSGAKNAIQSIGSTVTYLERYTLLALLGLATQNQDDDGILSEKISEDELNDVRAYVEELKIDEKKFLSFMHVGSFEDIPKRDYQKAIAMLEAKKKCTVQNENN